MKRWMVLSTIFVFTILMAEKLMAQVVVRDSVRIFRQPIARVSPQAEKPSQPTIVMENGVVSGFVIPYRANLQIYYDLAERLDWFMPPWASLVTVFNGDSVVVDSLLWRFPDITISPVTYFNGCLGSFEQHDWILFTNVSAPPDVYIFNAGLAAAGDTVQFVYDTESLFTGQRDTLGIWSADEVRLPDGTLVGWNVIFGEYDYCLDTWNDKLEIFIGMLPSTIEMTLVPSVIAPCDTALIILKKVNPDGTREDFPPGQNFEIGIVKGSNEGGILSPTPTPLVSDYFLDFEQPFAFIAESNITADSVIVQIRAGNPTASSAAVSSALQEMRFKAQQQAAAYLKAKEPENAALAVLAPTAPEPAAKKGSDQEVMAHRGKGGQHVMSDIPESEFVYSDFAKANIVIKQFLALQEVSFMGNDHRIVSDNGAVTYTAPHWRDDNLDGDVDDGGERKYPVAYTRNTTMMLAAKIFVDPAPKCAAIKVRGIGPGSLNVPETPALVNGNVVTLPETAASTPFLDEVTYFDPLVIDWEISFDNGSSWRAAGTSRNQVYVTLADPLVLADPIADPPDQPDWFHTLFHLGCKNAAGETTPEGALEKIWAEFADRDVKKAEGNLLTYYATWGCDNTTTASLLRTGDGQCIAWAKFFIDLLKVQGIDNNSDYVVIIPIDPFMPDEMGFLVKNWDFPLFGGGPSPYTSHPYYNKTVESLIVDNTYVWKSEDVEDEEGIPGQGEAIVRNPASLFNNHQLVFIGGKYYDPSYGGTPKSSLQELENEAIAGYFLLSWYRLDEPDEDEDLNGDGDKSDLDVLVEEYYIQKNPDGLQLIEFLRLNY